MLAASSTVRELTELVAQMAGLVVLAGTIAALAAFLYRWYVREQIPRGLSLLFGLTGITVYLNTSRALGQVIGGSTLPTETEVALFNIAAFALATGGAVVGRRAGDRFGTDVALRSSIDGIEKDVGRLVQSVGRVTAVELPEEIDDVVGYDPVPEETKEKLAGKTFLFPRRLTVTQLRERLVTRLRTDYAVGHVDVELADDGTVEYIALGSRAAGIGPTLPPATNAVALRADPAFAASAGDLVQVWETDPMRRVLTAELRGVAGDTVTVAIDAADTPKINPRKEYRLVTLPVDDRPDREFASLLRAADETFSSVTVEAGSSLHGLPVGALDLAVVAVKSEDEQPVALPERSYVLAPGDTVFAIARPEALRRLERAAEPLEPSLIPTGAGGQRQSEPAGRHEAAGEATSNIRSDDSVAESEPDTGTSVDDSTEQVDGAGERSDLSEDTVPAGENDTDGVSGRADASSFRDLKEEFESGDADWEDDEPATSTDATSGEDQNASDDATEDRSDESTADPGTGIDDLGLEGDVAGEDTGDDLAALDVDEPADGIGLEDDIGFEESGEGTDESSDGDENEDDDDGQQGEDEDDDSGGGTKSFQELKEEFESGDADWEDDVSDSPGGDMRLDE